MRAPILVAVAVTLALAPMASAQQATTRTIDVTLSDQGCPEGDHAFCIKPAEITTEPGSALELRITNAGEVRHNLTFAPGTHQALTNHSHPEPILPNQTLTLTIPWEALETAIEADETRVFTLTCGFEGHAALGETATLTVEPPEGENEQPLGWPLTALALVGAALVVTRRSGDR